MKLGVVRSCLYNLTQVLIKQTTVKKQLTVSWKTSLNRIIVRTLGGGPLSLNPLGLDSNKCYCAADTHSSARDGPETRPAAVSKSSRGIYCVSPAPPTPANNGRGSTNTLGHFRNLLLSTVEVICFVSSTQGHFCAGIVL